MAINWLENELVLCNPKDGTCKTFEFDITFRFYADTDVDSLVSPKFSAIVWRWTMFVLLCFLILNVVKYFCWFLEFFSLLLVIWGCWWHVVTSYIVLVLIPRSHYISIDFQNFWVQMLEEMCCRPCISFSLFFFFLIFFFFFFLILYIYKYLGVQLGPQQLKCISFLSDSLDIFVLSL